MNDDEVMTKERRLSFELVIPDEEEWKKDHEESQLLELLDSGTRDTAALKKKIKKIEFERVICDKRREQLQVDLAFLKQEMQTIAAKKDIVLKHLKDKIRRLRSFKQTMDEYEHKMSVIKYNKKPTDVDLRLGASSASAPLEVRENREHELYKRKIEIARFHSDPGNGTMEDDLNGTYRADVLGSRSRTFKIPKTDAVFSQEIKDAVQTFIHFFCMLKPEALKELWTKYVNTKERKKEAVLYVVNLPIFLDNLIIYVFKQENPSHTIPSRTATKPLVSFFQFKLAPYIGRKNYITLNQFMLFPQWLLGEKWIRETSPESQWKSLECMTPEEEVLRQQLKVGSTCNIWSDTNQMWCPGEVKRITHDDLGEWLLVRYICKRLVIEKDVQRFSSAMDISEKVTRCARSELKDNFKTYIV